MGRKALMAFGRFDEASDFRALPMFIPDSWTYVHAHGNIWRDYKDLMAADRHLFTGRAYPDMLYDGVSPWMAMTVL